MIIIFYLIFSFFFDSISTNYLNYELTNISYFKTIYTIISLVIVYEYYRHKSKYFITLIVISFLFDIRYTNTFILNPVIFSLIYLLNIILDNHLPNNILTINIKTITSINIYHLLTYIILIISNYNNYQITSLFTIIIRSIPMTIIYTTISYLTLKKTSPKLIK